MERSYDKARAAIKRLRTAAADLGRPDLAREADVLCARIAAAIDTAMSNVKPPPNLPLDETPTAPVRAHARGPLRRT